MFYPTINRFLIFCFIAIATVGADSSDNSDDNPSQAPELNDGYRKHNDIEAIRDGSTDDRDDNDDNPSIVSEIIDNESPVIPEHKVIEAIENETCDHQDENDLRLTVPNPSAERNAIDDETSDNSDDEWFCVDPKRYDPFQRKLNRFFARGYSHGHHHYPRGYCPRFYGHYPRGYRCELIEYIVYQNTAGFLYKVGGIFGRKKSKTVEEKEILVFEDMRRNIQWTWP